MAIGDDRFVPDKINGAASGPPRQVVAAAGAITIAQGVVLITAGSGIAVTIGDPPTQMDGAILHVISNTAQAHTLNNSAGSGFNIGGAASDIGTFGGAIGDGVILIAYAGNWLVSANTNVTLA